MLLTVASEWSNDPGGLAGHPSPPLPQEAKLTRLPEQPEIVHVPHATKRTSYPARLTGRLNTSSPVQLHSDSHGLAPLPGVRPLALAPVRGRANARWQSPAAEQSQSCTSSSQIGEEA
jgi:hypothetical protein